MSPLLFWPIHLVQWQPLQSQYGNSLAYPSYYCGPLINNSLFGKTESEKFTNLKLLDYPTDVLYEILIAEPRKEKTSTQKHSI